MLIQHKWGKYYRKKNVEFGHQILLKLIAQKEKKIPLAMGME